MLTHRTNQWLLISLLFLAACGGSRSSSNTSTSTMTFQEIYPENLGELEIIEHELKNQLWNETFKAGQKLERGVHFQYNQDDISEGLSFEIIITGKQTAEFRLNGQAQNHHVNDSFDFDVEFFKEAFFASTEDAFKRVPRVINFRAQFGEGFRLSGSTDSSVTSSLTLKELNTGEVIQVEPGQGWSMTKRIEPYEPYTLQVEQHPTGMCCYVSHGDGIMMEQDVNSIKVRCSSPSWEDPSDLTTNLSGTPAVSNIQSMDLNKSTFSSNQYGDAALLWQNFLPSISSTHGFLSFYNSNTDEWVHPPQGNNDGYLGVGLINPEEAVIPKAAITNGKNTSLMLFKQTDNVMSQNLFDWFGLNSLALHSLIHNQDLQNEEDTWLENQAFNKVLYRKGNTHLAKLRIEETGLNYRFVYEYSKNYRSDQGQFNQVQTFDIAEVPQQFYGGDMVPFLDGAINEDGDGFLIWTVQTSNADDFVDLYVLDVNDFQAESAQLQALQLNDSMMLNSPEFSMNEAGDIVVLWNETNESVDEIYFHRAEKNTQQPFWKHSANGNDSSYDALSTGAAQLPQESFVHLAQNQSGEWAAFHHGGNGFEWMKLFVSRNGVVTQYDPYKHAQVDGGTPSGAHKNQASLSMNDHGVVSLSFGWSGDPNNGNNTSLYSYIVEPGDNPNVDEDIEVVEHVHASMDSNVSLYERVKINTHINNVGRVSTIFQHPITSSRLGVKRATRNESGQWSSNTVSLDHLDSNQIVGHVQLIGSTQNHCGQAVIHWQAKTALGWLQQTSVRH